MKTFLTQTVLLFLLAMASFGCAGPTDPPPTSIQPLDQTRVQAALINIKSDPELAGCIITCRAENQLLIIDGKVNTEGAKKRAEDLARKTQGIKSIANHLAVDPNSHPVPGESAAP